MPSTILVHYCDLLFETLRFTANHMLIVSKNIDIQQSLEPHSLKLHGPCRCTVSNWVQNDLKYRNLQRFESLGLTVHENILTGGL